MKKIYKIAGMSAILVVIALFIFLKNSSGTKKMIVLNKDISSGTIITENMLSFKTVPSTEKLDGLVKNKNDVVGKSLNVSRISGDNIPEKIVKKANIYLQEGEVLFSFKVPESDMKLIKEGNEVELALLSDSSKEPVTVRNIYIMYLNNEFNDNTNGDTSSKGIIAYAKTSDQIATKIAPYIKESKYKLIVLPEDKKEYKEENKNKVDSSKKENVTQK